MGRSSKYTPQLADAICKRMAEGEFLAAICRDDGMPGLSTVYDWIVGKADFAGKVARAREVGYDVLAVQCIDIADDERHDWKMTQKGSITDEVAISRARLRVDTRMKLLAKWDPKRYGEKLDVHNTGDVTIKFIKGGKPDP